MGSDKTASAIGGGCNVDRPRTNSIQQGIAKAPMHRAVLIDGWDVEQVHHLRNVKSARRPGGLAYTITMLSQGRLARGEWTIFFVDVVGFPQRVIRSKNSRLLKEFFADGQTRVSVYIPLNGRPSMPRAT